MAGRFRQYCGYGARAAASALVSLFFWTLWTALILLLAAQAYIASKDELPVPRFIQHSLEARLAVSGVHATFGRTIFDPSGRILIENVKVSLPGLGEQVVTARAIYSRLDPWALLEGRFEPVELRVTGVSLRVPAMLSPSGKSDAIVGDLDAAFVPNGDELTIEYLNCHLGNLAVSAYGGVHLSRRANANKEQMPIAQFLTESYAPMSREGADIVQHFGVLDHPVLLLHLVPDEKRGAVAHFAFAAQGLHLDFPVPVDAADIRATGVYSPASDAASPADLAVTANRVSLPRFGSILRGVEVRIRGSMPPGQLQPGRSPITVSEVAVAASNYTSGDLSLENPILTVTGAGNGVLTNFSKVVPAPFVATLQARVLDEPVSIESQIDLANRSAYARFTGAVSPAILDAIGKHWHKDLSSVVELSSPVLLSGKALFESGWKFARASAEISTRDLTYRTVKIDELRGFLDFDGLWLRAPEAYARIGADEARGSFEWNRTTNENRYLLDGGLRPLDITPWIGAGTQPFWKQFFGDLKFPTSPATASMDLRSNFTSGRHLQLFISVDAASPAYRGVSMDTLHTRLFIRPHWVDILDFAIHRGNEAASGSGSYRHDPESGSFVGVGFDVDSTLDIGAVAQAARPYGDPILSPYAFAKPPKLKVSGEITGPAAPEGAHQNVSVHVVSDSTTRYRDFPFDRMSLQVDLKDDNIRVTQVSGAIGGGTLAGNAAVSGKGDDQKLSFEASLTGANLAQIIQTVEAWEARRDNKPPPPLSEFLSDKADVRLDSTLAATGSLSDSLSFQGNGTASLKGSDLLQLKMMGLLSDLLQFTSLRFTSAKTAFQLDRARLIFPKIDILGANSGIAATGNYLLSTHQLDFRARINPFQESKSVPQKFMGLVLTPLSSALEVKLIGDIEKPKWVFANGPTNFFRTLGQSNSDRSTPAAANPPSPLK